MLTPFKCDDPLCDDVNCRLYWGIIQGRKDLLEHYSLTLNNKYCDAEDVDYKAIVESLISYIDKENSK